MKSISHRSSATSTTTDNPSVSRNAAPRNMAQGSGKVMSGRHHIAKKQPNSAYLRHNPGYVAPNVPKFGGPNKPHQQ